MFVLEWSVAGVVGGPYLPVRGVGRGFDYEVGIMKLLMLDYFVFVRGGLIFLKVGSPFRTSMNCCCSSIMVRRNSMNC